MGAGGGGKPDYSIRISKSKLRVDKQPAHQGPAVLRGRRSSKLCRAPSRCGAARRRWAASRSPTTANKNRNVTVRIKKSAYKRLKRKGKIRTTITVVTRGTDGVLRKKSRRVTMVRKAAKKAKKKQ